MGSYIKLALQAFSTFFGWLGKRQEIANDPALKANKLAQQEQTEKDKGSAEIGKAARGDKDAMRDLRNDIAE